MKTLFRWKKGYLFVLFLIMLSIIMFTRHDMNEERSKEGQTVMVVDYAYTYLNNEKCTFRTPSAWKRFFKDTEETWIASYFRDGGMDFISYVEDGSIDFSVSVLPMDLPECFNDIEDFALMSKEEKDKFQSEVLDLGEDTIEGLRNRKIDITAGFSYMGEDCYFMYVDKSYVSADKEYVYSLNYLFLKDGRFIVFSLNYYTKDNISFDEGVKNVEAIMWDCLSCLSWDNSLKKYGKVSGDSFVSRLTATTFPIWVFALPLVLVLICNMQVIDKSLKHTGIIHWQEDALGLDNSKTVLGFFAILVMFHHIAQTVGRANSSIFVILENFGVYLVAGYFFFSGYGLMKSVNQKKDYMKGFLKKRLPKILVPFYVCIFVFILVGIITGKLSVDFSKAHFSDSFVLGRLDLLKAAVGIDLINPQMWYIVEIFIIYIAFYVFYKLLKKEGRVITAMTLFIVGLTIYALFRGHGGKWFQGEWWYNSSLIFVVGMISAYKEEIITGLIKKYYVFYIAGTLGFFVLFSRITKYMLEHHGYWTDKNSDKFMTLGPQLLKALFFVLLIVGILFKVKFKNRALSLLGKISLEIYLLHYVFITYGKDIRGTGIYVLFIITGTIILAYAVHIVDTFIICKLLKKPVPKIFEKKATSKIKRQRFGLLLKMNLQYVKRHKMRTVIIVLRSLFCAVLCFLSLFPLYLMFINSSLSMGELVKGIHFIPGTKFVDNYNEFNLMAKRMAGGVKMALVRSCMISGSAALLATYFGAACAYGFEIYDFKGKKQLWRVVVMALMFSAVGGSIGYLKLVMKLHLLNSYLTLIIPAIATPSAAYFMRMYLRTLNPREIVEAARIDGCSEIGIFNRIAIPMLKPALSLLMIFNFVSSWNNSYMQSLVLTKPSQKTLALFMKKFVGYSKGTDPTIYMLVVLSIIPPIVVYIIFAKSITSRIVIGAVKE